MLPLILFHLHIGCISEHSVAKKSGVKDRKVRGVEGIIYEHHLSELRDSFQSRFDELFDLILIPIASILGTAFIQLRDRQRAGCSFHPVMSA